MTLKICAWAQNNLKYTPPHSACTASYILFFIHIYLILFQRNPPPGKKSKTSAPSARTDAADPTWMLDSKKRITVREFKGKVYIDIREFYEKNGTFLPGKKGISLTPEQWRKLLSLGDDVNEAVSNLH